MLRNRVAIRPDDLPPGVWMALEALWRGKEKHDAEEMKKLREKNPNQDPRAAENKRRYRE